ncbi:hypothetical protein GOBAR_AA17007 [Gossypium barbadense]|uniref:Uncharacterized protein n=1 Tax=Gossypium barbadense TaxID=3634 RepID=A0A2P5XK00_GOSBA|nr:hypothetical protein GOBAR_AA17007 [Gossypium barbadense]
MSPRPYDKAVDKTAKPTRAYTMSSSRGKKIDVPASKKRKGAASSLGPTDDVPPRHEDPPSQPPSIHCPVHAVASLSDISERLT